MLGQAAPPREGRNSNCQAPNDVGTHQGLISCWGGTQNAMKLDSQASPNQGNYYERYQPTNRNEPLHLRIRDHDSRNNPTHAPAPPPKVLFRKGALTTHTGQYNQLIT